MAIKQRVRYGIVIFVVSGLLSSGQPPAPTATLIFEVELLEVLPADDPSPETAGPVS